MYWYLKVWKETFNFSGRARRKEYWMFALVNMLITLLLGLLCGGLIALTGAPQFMFIYIGYSFLVIVPSIAVSVRRAHDSDHSGWWMLLPLYNLFLLIAPKGKIDLVRIPIKSNSNYS